MSDKKDFEVIPLRAFRDNYIWTLRNDRYAAVVDPGDAQPVLDYLRRERLELCAILATHHHADPPNRLNSRSASQAPNGPPVLRSGRPTAPLWDQPGSARLKVARISAKYVTPTATSSSQDSRTKRAMRGDSGFGV